MAIRDSKLYRAEHKTFETYCQAKWGWTRRHANYLIEAPETVEAIGNNCSQKPATESQARPLSALPKESRAEAWEEVIERAPVVNGQPRVTAKLVKDVVDEWAAEDEPDALEEVFDYVQPQPPPSAVRRVA